MRHINANNEVNIDGNIEEYEEDAINQEVPPPTAGQVLNQRKKKKPYKSDNKPVPTMEEKKNIRDKMFNMMEESRINEMRLVRIESSSPSTFHHHRYIYSRRN